LLLIINIVPHRTGKGNKATEKKGLLFSRRESIIFPWRCGVMTTEDLQAIRAIVREENAKTEARLDAMQADIDQIKGDVGRIKEDIKRIKADGAITREDIERIKADGAITKEDIEQIKEDGAITREAVNAIGDWTDAASDVLKIRYPVER
jgi:peptidoglycan hydrolase CwlO-like protein